ncbi:hypothetical protein C8R46DRAFT_1197092 [Mycena filopes]|nr:hypothetical protein C8R46DRAFT_1197092 [Mycena filopes]
MAAAAAAPSKFTPPKGFLAVNDEPTELWSQAAFDHVTRLQDEEEKRNPDAHGLYIYNDYFGYACCDLLKEEMLAIGKLISKKAEKLSIATFHRLEALTLYMANSNAASVFPTIDDADLAEAIYNAYGALWMTYVLDLETAAKPQKLSATHPVGIPNLENAVRTSAKVITIFRDLGFEQDANALQDALLRVLERNDMDGTRKEQLFLGDDSDDEDEDGDEDEEDEDDEEPRAKKTPKETRPAKKARRGTADDKDVRAAAKTWKASAAMKALREQGPVEHGGRPWDITKWPAAELAREKSRFDDDDF